jgi:hypothetical protein
MTTSQQRAVETVEELKLRIAGIIRGNVQVIPPRVARVLYWSA